MGLKNIFSSFRVITLAENSPVFIVAVVNSIKPIKLLNANSPVNILFSIVKKFNMNCILCNFNLLMKLTFITGLAVFKHPGKSACILA